MPRSRKRKHDDRDYYKLKKKLKKLVKKRSSRSRSRKRRHGSTSSSQESLRDRDRSGSVRRERERHHYSERSPDTGHTRSRHPSRARSRSRSRYSSRDRRSLYGQQTPYSSEFDFGDEAPAVHEPSASASISVSRMPQDSIPAVDVVNAAPAITAPAATAPDATAPATSATATDVPTTAPVATAPATSATATDAPATAAPVTDPTTTEMELDSAILEIFGEDPTQTKKYGSEIQKDLAVRLEHTATNGLQKDTKKDLREKYLIPSNCKLIDAPALNPEIKVAVSEAVHKRDKAIEAKQKQVACAIACLSQAITRVVSAKEKDTELIKLLMNAEQLLCDTQYSDTSTRRVFILTSVKKDMKEQLENTKPDNFLFGQNLSETLKTAKAINKSGAELKVSTAPKPSMKKPPPGPSRALNSRGPPARRSAGPPRTKEPAPPKNQHTRYLKPSQRRHQQPRR